MEAPEVQREFSFAFRGEGYTLSLRASDDGFVSAGEVQAVKSLLRGIVSADEILGDDATGSRLFRLLTNEGFKGEIMSKSAGKPIPIPWQSWLDLPADVLGDIIAVFFCSLMLKIERLGISPFSTETANLLALTLLQETNLSSTSRSQLMEYSKRHGLGITAPDSKSTGQD